MKLHEKYTRDLLEGLQILNDRITVHHRVLNESSNLTYHELRAFITLLMKSISNKDTKKTLNDILMAMGKLEVLNRPAPTIKKMKGVSPKIFQ